tara:strand:+ start:921 stop:2171 length:1251 start_codon:yes stop_codon:yes gene_type:complete
MNNLKEMLANSDDVTKRLSTRGFSLDLGFLNENSNIRKTLIQEKEDLASEKNKISDSFRAVSSDSEKSILMEKSKSIEGRVADLKKQLSDVEDKLNNHLLQIPNIPHHTCPIGNSEEDNILIEKHGAISNTTSDEHSDILNKLDMLSFEDAVKITQNRFVVLKGQVASLHRALINYMLSKQVKNGYQEYNVPYICNSDSLIGTGQLPKFEEDLFKLSNANLYLIPTAEVPLTNIYRGVTLSPEDLPVLMTAHTPCFRSEAGSYGLDTKGLIRQHQFEKIELVQLVHPDKSEQALDEITLHARSILNDLELPYQVIELCTGDLGFSSQKTYDLEVWFPSQKKYREVSSCSNFGDFQARRLNIKFKEDKQKDFVHTLNGSGLAVGRTLAALVENNFDGTKINIPNCLHKYLDFKTIEL